MNGEQKAQIAMILLGSVVVILLLLALTSAIMQACAAQSYVLTQRLFPALQAGGYPFWMDWGTLLGARREGGMIAHDYDADIGMRESDFQRLKAAWSRDARFRGMRLCRENANLYRVRAGLGWVDVFRYEDKSGDMLNMLSMCNSKHSCACVGRGHRVSSTLLFPLTVLRFGAVHAPAPADTDGYLTHLYGKQWHIPKKNNVSYLLSLLPCRSPVK